MTSTDAGSRAPDLAASDAARAAKAKLLLLLLAVLWGCNWTAARLALYEIPPWSLRFAGVGIGTVLLFAISIARGGSLAVPRRQYIHIVVAGFFNVAAFNIISAYAQMGAGTSRAVIIAYSMPIWATIMARFTLGERLNAVRFLGVALCAGGLAVLVWPLLAHGIPFGVIDALGCALSWAAGTIYMKWARIAAPPMAIAAWQLLFGWVLIAVGMLLFEGAPQLWPLSPRAVAALAYNGLIGIGFAYFVWFVIVERLPTATASLGSLLVPVVGVMVSALVLGERPTANDLVGFALIFAAAACVLLQPAPLSTRSTP